MSSYYSPLMVTHCIIFCLLFLGISVTVQKEKRHFSQEPFPGTRFDPLLPSEVSIVFVINTTESDTIH